MQMCATSALTPIESVNESLREGSKLTTGRKKRGEMRKNKLLCWCISLNQLGGHFQLRVLSCSPEHRTSGWTLQLLPLPISILFPVTGIALNPSSSCQTEPLTALRLSMELLNPCPMLGHPTSGHPFLALSLAPFPLLDTLTWLSQGSKYKGTLGKLAF